MRVVILGASGGCGAALVDAAVAAGHAVVAVVRPASKLPDRAGVDARRGDLGDASFLASCFEGADVVLSALGLRLSGIAPWSTAEDPTFLTRSTPAIVAAARSAGVRRVLAISAGGVGDSWPIMPGFFKAFIRLTALRIAYAELEVMERVYLDSGLDVCLCRPTGLTDGPATGQVVVAASLTGRATISRADVAAWMLAAATAATAPRTALITVTGAG